VQSGAEDLQDPAPLGERLGVAAVDAGDVDAPLEQGVGGREAAHPEAGDEHA